MTTGIITPDPCGGPYWFYPNKRDGKNLVGEISHEFRKIDQTNNPEGCHAARLYALEYMAERVANSESSLLDSIFRVAVRAKFYPVFDAIRALDWNPFKPWHTPCEFYDLWDLMKKHVPRGRVDLDNYGRRIIAKVFDRGIEKACIARLEKRIANMNKTRSAGNTAG